MKYLPRLPNKMAKDPVNEICGEMRKTKKYSLNVFMRKKTQNLRVSYVFLIDASN